MDLIRTGSSAVDWCESNYKMVSFIAEFFNTFSNILFFIIPPIMVILFQDFGNYVTKGIHLIWLLLVAVGVGSVYFHATLSMAGQLMDELLILWVLMASYTILFPEKYMPSYFKKKRKLFVFGFILTTIIITFLCCLKPKLNAYFLMLFSIPILSVMHLLVKESKDLQVKTLAKRISITWLLAITCWICDRAFCDLWIRIDMPYLHSVFHIFVFLSSCSSVVLYAYFTALYKVPELEPKLAYWPTFSDKQNKLNCLCLPYIDFSINQNEVYSKLA